VLKQVSRHELDADIEPDKHLGTCPESRRVTVGFGYEHDGPQRTRHDRIPTAGDDQLEL
jgi:hypothetical protein